jgi:hypothetical protein
MSKIVDKATDSAGDPRFDRLVDGELSALEYRSLLASLDDEPGGWRRCALAFLEAQALECELGALRRAADSCTGLAAHRAIPAGHFLSGSQLTFLAVAASFVIAFSLGIVAPRFFSMVSWPGRQDQTLAGNNTFASPPRTGFETVPAQALTKIGNLRLVMDGPNGEPSQSRQVPVYEVGQNLDEFLAHETPALGPELIEYLQQEGYEVRHEQQYFPAPLDDGRQIIVPVDGYQITPVSRRY